MSFDIKEKLYTPEQAAEILHMTVRTVRGWCRSGRIRAYKVGSCYRIPESAIREKVQSLEVKDAEEA